MAQIKIISNPYKKEIQYQKQADGCWENIEYSNSGNSKLVSNEFTHGFFPFVAKKIVDSIVEEYEADGERIGICFEGSADEYKELEEVCALPELRDKDIQVIRSEVYLENARDILPKVKELFQELSPLVIQSVSMEKIQRDLGRYSDASSDVVPICVLGNYSAGKSTFINALIGSEILPSGTEPVTAKVYKILRSKYPDRAIVRCSYLDKDINITFAEQESYFEGDPNETPLKAALKEGLAGTEKESIPFRVNKALTIINGFGNDTEAMMVSDLIVVEIPFAKGVLAQSQHPFVLFDTPGSNSASNARHLQVLKEAMSNMTNGLPVFLSTPDSLDSTDNEHLYHIIRDMEELDNRFTMIVVNKADGPGLQRKETTEAEKNHILNQAVPRNLYSGGLFYVSSILGLGSKNNGEFLDDFYLETYEDQVGKFDDPTSRRYKTLYIYDIMPDQIKKRADSLAAERTDLVYANSGLFSIETQIENFAGKYSAYNKCFQSQLFLRRIIKITGEEIADKKVQCDEIRQNIHDKLEEDKKKLIDKINQTAQEERECYDASYEGFMSEFYDKTDSSVNEESLKQRVEELTDQYEQDFGYDDRQNEVKQRQSAIGANLVSKFKNAEKLFSTETFKSAVDGLKADVSAVIDSVGDQYETRVDIDRNASAKLLEEIANTYEEHLQEKYDLLNSKSREYWTEKTEMLRKLLATIVMGSDVLTNERRKELEQIIIMYQKVAFEEKPAQDIFNKDNFVLHIKVGDFNWQANHLLLGKLNREYEKRFKEGVETRYNSISESHQESAHVWIQNLLDVICENIVEYSPELSKQAKQIRMMTEQIEDLIRREGKLNEYTDTLTAMMDWHKA